MKSCYLISKFVNWDTTLKSYMKGVLKYGGLFLVLCFCMVLGSGIEISDEPGREKHALFIRELCRQHAVLTKSCAGSSGADPYTESPWGLRISSILLD